MAQCCTPLPSSTPATPCDSSADQNGGHVAGHPNTECLKAHTSPPYTGLSSTERTGTSLRVLDTVGGTLSFACAAHCLLLPLFLTALPLLGLGFLAETRFELAMVVVALTLATGSLCWGIKVHGQWKMVSFLLAAGLFFYLGHDLGSHSPHGDHSHAADATTHWILMGIGGLSLAVGHFVNLRLCRSCHTCASH
jgi:hypothetical protein